MPRILLGVSGGIAAYKALEFTRLAVKAGHAVRVIQTPTSTRFVGRASFEALTGAPVLSSEFDRDPARGAFAGDRPPTHDPISHLELIGNAEVFLIAPASANTIAKLAHGLADNLLCSAALAARCPIILAPAMNDAMYEHAATQENLKTLRQRGARIIDPGHGSLASKGEFGVGRLAEPPELLAACETALAARLGPSLAGLRILITAGGTREPIDAVRYIGNRSSGRMGFALAEQAARRGAAVTVIAANVTLAQAMGVKYRMVQTAAELERACSEEFPSCEVLLMAAAVADFRPSSAAPGKIKKDEHAPDAITLQRTTDVLTSLATQRRADQTLIGFAAEHGEGALARAREKLRRKRLDAIVVNDVSRPGIGFDSEHNEVTMLSADRELSIPRASKQAIAAAILDEVTQLRAVAIAATRKAPDASLQ
jgi:phosphopantothenoylcysteine decarboxylase / phosphopantothenate---cysteine ligase